MKFDIDYFAKLAYLELGDHKDKILDDLEHITDMVNKMPNIEEDKSVLTPLYSMALRKDEVKNSLTRKEVLMNAEEVQAGCIVVPKTVE